MPAKTKGASSSGSSGIYVRISLADPLGKVFMNALGKVFLFYNSSSVLIFQCGHPHLVLQRIFVAYPSLIVAM